MKSLALGSALIGFIGLLSGCVAPPSGDPGQGPFAPVYGQIKTELLEGDLVSFSLQMRGARDNGDVQDFADCAAAQYAVIRGYGFARHISTTSQVEDGIWNGQSVYTISPGLPRGLATIDAEVTLANCREAGIPTV